MKSFAKWTETELSSVQPPYQPPNIQIFRFILGKKTKEKKHIKMVGNEGSQQVA